MIRESELIFSEEQKFSYWLRWLIALSMALAVSLSIFSLTNTFSDGSSSDIWPIITVGICLPITIGILFLLSKLETEVRSDGLYIRYFPIHINFKRFATSDLSKCYAREYDAGFEYGGWGIKYGLRLRIGKAYSVSGNKGVQLVFKNGKRLLIGSQRAEELEEAIRSIMESN